MLCLHLWIEWVQKIELKGRPAPLFDNSAFKKEMLPPMLPGPFHAASTTNAGKCVSLSDLHTQHMELSHHKVGICWFFKGSLQICSVWNNSKTSQALEISLLLLSLLQG